MPVRRQRVLAVRARSPSPGAAVYPLGAAYAVIDGSGTGSIGELPIPAPRADASTGARSTACAAVRADQLLAVDVTVPAHAARR